MKKFKLFSFASFIKGRKSSGTEDVSGFKHWNLKVCSSLSSEIN